MSEELSNGVMGSLVLSEKAIKCFEDALKACGTMKKRMLDGSIIVRDDLCKAHGLPWETISRRSRKEWLLKMFNVPIYKVCKVGEIGGIPEESYRRETTEIIKQLCYQSKDKLFPGKYARYSYEAIDDIVEVAEGISGSSSYEQKIERAVAKCKKNPDWAGHPPSQRGKRRSTDPSDARISLPNLNSSEEANQWLRDFLKAIAVWRGRPCLNGAMTHAAFLSGHRDTRFKKVSECTKVLEELLEQFPSEHDSKVG